MRATTASLFSMEIWAQGAMAFQKDQLASRCLAVSMYLGTGDRFNGGKALKQCVGSQRMSQSRYA